MPQRAAAPVPPRYFPQPPPPGTRVRHGSTGALGLVTGKPEPFKASYLLPITIEGTTRTELWPAGLIDPLPKEQQLKAMGGCLSAPKGYPLTKLPNP